MNDAERNDLAAKVEVAVDELRELERRAASMRDDPRFGPVALELRGRQSAVRMFLQQARPQLEKELVEIAPAIAEDVCEARADVEATLAKHQESCQRFAKAEAAAHAATHTLSSAIERARFVLQEIKSDEISDMMHDLNTKRASAVGLFQGRSLDADEIQDQYLAIVADLNGVVLLATPGPDAIASLRRRIQRFGELYPRREAA